MATLAPAQHENANADSFFRIIAMLMALTIIAGFSLQFARGFSSLAARPLVHVHGIAFMSWVALFVTQSWLATRGPIALHRKLGWLGAGWVVVLVVLGCWITIDVIQRGTAPFFFQPQHFLIANPLSAFVFALLVYAAIRLRHRTDWHMRLQICAMTAIIGPAFGRLLPMPLFMPYAFEAAGIAGMMFAVAGMIRDRRTYGRVHAAWWWGLGAILAIIPVSVALANSPIGDALYAAVTAGHPGASLPGMEFPPPPPMPG
jgi:hypothetical protein